jgi:phosphatidylinositol alpha 1,6-mannosyltransferase
MRVAIVTETFEPSVNGIVRMLRAYLAYLHEHGHLAMLFAPGAGDTRCEGFRVMRVAGLPCPHYPALTLAPYSTQMGPLLRSWRPESSTSRDPLCSASTACASPGPWVCRSPLTITPISPR